MIYAGESSWVVGAAGSRTKCRVGFWVTGIVPGKLLADGNEDLELPEYTYSQLLQHCLLLRLSFLHCLCAFVKIQLFVYV